MTTTPITETDAQAVQAKRAEKVRKLLDKADRAGTPEEAETFYAKAQELMTQWVLDEAMVANAGHRPEAIIHHQVFLSGVYAREINHLLDDVARAMGCRTYYVRLDKNHYRTMVVGFESDAKAVEMMVTSLQLQAARFSKTAEKPAWWDDLDWDGKVHQALKTARRKWMKSYYVGFGREAARRLRETRTSTAETQPGGSLLPVLMDRDAQVQSVLDGMNLREARGFEVSAHGSAAGRAAARNADLGQAAVKSPGVLPA